MRPERTGAVHAEDRGHLDVGGESGLTSLPSDPWAGPTLANGAVGAKGAPEANNKIRVRDVNARRGFIMKNNDARNIKRRNQNIFINPHGNRAPFKCMKQEADYELQYFLKCSLTGYQGT